MLKCNLCLKEKDNQEITPIGIYNVCNSCLAKSEYVQQLKDQSHRKNCLIKKLRERIRELNDHQYIKEIAHLREH